MPSIIDWKTSPLQIVDQVFTSHLRSPNGNWHETVAKNFKEKLTPEEWNQIPSLNGNPNHAFVDGQLVRFRGMIQDMFDPELYLSEYEHKDPKTGEVKISTNRYRENVCCGEEEVNFDSGSIKNEERMAYFCVQIPGESDWVSKGFKSLSPQVDLSTDRICPREKRTREDDADEQMDSETSADVQNPISAVKKTKVDHQNGVNGNQTDSKNSTQGQSVIVKLYDVEDGALSLNDAVEFVGIISMDPSLARATFNADDPKAGAPMEEDVVADFEKKELEAKNPPTSLVPRLHVLHYYKLSSGNPLLPFNHEIGYLNVDIGSVRKELQSYLSKLLFGDNLAAEYMICHLISKVYLRRDVLNIGKLSINLFGIPLEKDYSKRVCKALQSLVCKSRFLELTVDNLNKLPFVPKKDYESNRLETGLLQLSPHTHLFLDETSMQNGQLNTEGVKNITALGNLIRWQRIPYNFNFHEIDFLKDVPCLVLSEGRSILPSDCQILIKPNFTDVDEALSPQLDPESLDRIRVYISLLRHCSAFELSDEMQTYIQDDFVKERAEPQSGINSDDLHGLLVLARLLAISRGLITLTEDIWTETKKMEKERKERMAHLPHRPGGH